MTTPQSSPVSRPKNECVCLPACSGPAVQKRLMRLVRCSFSLAKSFGSVMTNVGSVGELRGEGFSTKPLLERLVARARLHRHRAVRHHLRGIHLSPLPRSLG